MYFCTLVSLHDASACGSSRDASDLGTGVSTHTGLPTRGVSPRRTPCALRGRLIASWAPVRTAGPPSPAAAAAGPSAAPVPSICTKGSLGDRRVSVLLPAEPLGPRATKVRHRHSPAPALTPKGPLDGPLTAACLGLSALGQA